MGRLDYTKRIRVQMLAFETFLEEPSEHRGNVSFFQIATPSRTGLQSCDQIRREVDEVVGRISGRFSKNGWVPVNFRYRTHTQYQLCSFYYRAADAALITPLHRGPSFVTVRIGVASGRRFRMSIVRPGWVQPSIVRWDTAVCNPPPLRRPGCPSGRLHVWSIECASVAGAGSQWSGNERDVALLMLRYLGGGGMERDDTRS